jgi:hypothetical protein
MGGMTALDSLAAQVTSAVTGMGVTAVVVAVVVAEAVVAALLVVQASLHSR